MQICNTLYILSIVIGVTSLGMGIPAYLFHLFSPDSSVEYCMIAGGVWFGLFLVLYGEYHRVLEHVTVLPCVTFGTARYNGPSSAMSRRDWTLAKERMAREQGHPFV